MRYVKTKHKHISFDHWCFLSGQAAQPGPLAELKIRMAVYGQRLDGMHSGPRLAEKARYNSLLKIK